MQVIKTNVHRNDIINVNPSRPVHSHIALLFIFTLFCGAFKVFTKPFAAPRRGIKIKI